MPRHKPLICVIGYGRIGRILVNYLVNSTNLLIVEQDISVIQEIEEKYSSEDVIVLSGDASSSHFMKKVEDFNIYQTFVTLSDDELVIEVIEILRKQLKLRNIVTYVSHPDIVAKLKLQDVIVTSIPDILASYLINQVGLGENIAFYVGKGVGEIRQIQLTTNSPLIDKPLGELPPRRWIIGAIYRPKFFQDERNITSYTSRLQITQDDEFIIPTGKTRPQGGDKLLLIGDPHILKSTAQYLKVGSPVFPTRHGANVVIAIPFKFERDMYAYREYLWLTKNMAPARFVFIYHDKKYLSYIQNISLPVSQNNEMGDQDKVVIKVDYKDFIDSFDKIMMKDRVGLIVARFPRRFLSQFIFRKIFLPRILKRVRIHNSPIWIIKSHAPIRKAVLLVSDQQNILPVAELAIDVVSKLHIPLSVLKVTPPSIIAGKAFLEESETILQSIKDLCALYSIKVDVSIKEGNPVYTTLEILQHNELLIAGFKKGSNRTYLIPNTTKSLIKQFKGSMLILAT